MEKLTFNVSQIQVKNLDGEVLPINLSKPLGNFIYSSIAELDWLEAAQQIHKNEAIELTSEQLSNLSSLVDSGRCTFVLAVKQAIQEYITNLLKTSNNAKSSK